MTTPTPDQRPRRLVARDGDGITIRLPYTPTLRLTVAEARTVRNELNAVLSRIAKDTTE